MNSTTPFSPLAFTAADTGVGLGVGSGVVTIGGVVVGGEGVVPVVHVVGQSGRPAAPHPPHVGVQAEYGSARSLLALWQCRLATKPAKHSLAQQRLAS